MSKRKTNQFFEEVRRIALNLTQEEESLSPEQVRACLRETGIDADELKARFYEAALKLARNEMQSNRSLPSLLKQAIDTTRPEHLFPNTLATAKAFAERWLDKFSSSFLLPANFEVQRSYRKSDDLSDTDKIELDQLEKQLKQKVKSEHERKT